MTRQVLCAVLLMAGTAAAQERRPATDAHRATIELEKLNQLAGKLRGAVEMRTTTGAPYSGEATTEFVQVLPDGNRIARKTVVRIFRDSEGRVRREHLSSDGTQVESITIVDPVSGTSVLLDPEAKIVVSGSGGGRGRGWGSVPGDIEKRKASEERKWIEAGRVSVVPIPLPSPAPVAIARTARPESGNENVTRQELGQRSIEGVNARGTRTTTVIPAGAIGNDQPIRIVSEEWFSPDLQVLVLTKHSDPRSGETTYSLSHIVRAEPARSFFEVPPDYTRK